MQQGFILKKHFENLPCLPDLAKKWSKKFFRLRRKCLWEGSFFHLMLQSNNKKGGGGGSGQNPEKNFFFVTMAGKSVFLPKVGGGSRSKSEEKIFFVVTMAGKK